ncbi:MAG: group II intron reverse transcriptase/maturase [Desulfomonile tiedjei]|nr:group II intron reverse transcriptase/maturase [Desulfomonile tiedjei]
MERAKRDPNERLLSLAHLITPLMLMAAYQDLRKDAAVGVDGVTKEAYGENLEQNIMALHGRMKSGGYRHQPIRRVEIPKEGGKLRPLGISAIVDKIVQRALVWILGAIYEQDFKPFSYGFRPGLSAHDALRALNQMIYQGGVNYILEADIKAYFDSINRKQLMDFLRIRVADESLLRLVGKCLHVGVMDGEDYSESEDGTTQGSIISPLLGNVYLHYVLDVWFEQEVKPRLKGKAYLVRYADDFVMGFELEEDAKRVYEVIEKRFEKYHLELHPDKTRLLSFGKPLASQERGKGPGTFDFLGFTHYWRRSPKGFWVPALKTRKARLRKANLAITDFCKRHRHKPVKEQHAALIRRLRGHMNYFGVNGNIRALRILKAQAERIWHNWLNRRSQRSRLTWGRFKDLLKDFPLPTPQIKVQIWG